MSNFKALEYSNGEQLFNPIDRRLNQSVWREALLYEKIQSRRTESSIGIISLHLTKK
ncbi:hypothetical protein SAMN03080617_03184 [Algoriphagus alkaliphilus]|uniref:Uncharacterized protein n=1 Tax=Algoriphagus alkaliphilus TaxID=279824 RepID=A0A1G5Z4W0_9BACT|nr:hypothetical protein SAMN03080617_03184 [Algoriphagus alkaliphilus]